MTLRIHNTLRLVAIGIAILGWTCCPQNVPAQNVDSLETVIERAVNSVVDSIVQIETVGGLPRVDNIPFGKGPVTGLVVEQGYVLSAAFNFAHQPAAIFVRLPNRERVTAEIVGRDSVLNLVLLKVHTTKQLVVPKFVSRDRLQVGQTVVAVGKCYDASSPNLSLGILSATDRIWGRAVQTDAKISTANYGGPLIDLQGNVIGVLAPLSPNSSEITAGSEWYDSGIGFAVPLDRLLERLPLLKSGKSRRPGKLGISFQGTDIYNAPPVVAYCHGASPARIAGIRPGDQMIAIDGQPLIRQAQLKHVLGPMYEGDTVKLVVQRGAEEIQFKVRLVGELRPFIAAGMGLIVQSNPESKPVVSYLFPNSPALEAGLLIGDQIVSVAGHPVGSRNEIGAIVLQKSVGDKIQLQAIREGKSFQTTIRLSRQTAHPPARLALEKSADSVTLDVRVPEFKNRAFAIVPRGTARASGLLVWVNRAGVLDRQIIAGRWQKKCEQHNVALLVVASASDQKWQRDEAEFIVRAIQLLKQRTQFANNRIAIGGTKSGGAMAAITAFQNRALFRGLVLLDSAIPISIPKPEPQATHPLFLYFGISDASATTSRKSANRLQTSQFPVFVAPGSGEQPSVLLNWVQSLGRL